MLQVVVHNIVCSQQLVVGGSQYGNGLSREE